MKHLLKTEFEVSLYAAAQGNFNEKSNVLRINNYAYVIRELIDRLLIRHSPNADVERCSWYEEPSEGERKHTRRHRLLYAIAGGLSIDYVESELGLNVNIHISKINKDITSVSKLVHISEKTFGANDEEAVKKKIEIDSIFERISTQILSVREELYIQLLESIDNDLHKEGYWNGFDEIDGLGGNQSFSMIEDIEGKVIRVDAEYFHIEVAGRMTIDVERGGRRDGISHAFEVPVMAKFKGRTSDPTKLAISDHGIKVSISDDELDRQLRE